jgi:hypothetical protein
MNSFPLIALTASAFVSSAATAGLAVYQQYETWAFSLNNGLGLAGQVPLSIITENFNAYSGAYANPLVGNAGPIEWTAVSYNTASPGLFANNGWLSTSGPDEVLNFTFEPGVYAVGGNFFSRDAAFELRPALVSIFFADGSASVQYVTSATGFSGFTSSGVAISSMSMQVYPVPAGVNYIAVDNLYFGVPSPGAFALLGVAGLVGGRRRR